MGKVLERLRSLIGRPGRKVSEYLSGNLAARVEELQGEMQRVKETVEDLREQVDDLLAESGGRAPEIVQEEEETITAETVKSIREERGASQGELAELLDVSPKTVESWEGGRSRPGAENRAKISKLREETAEAPEEVPEPEEQKQTFSPEEITELRQQLGMSQAVLARELGVAPNTVWKWENGRSSPNDSSVKALAGLQSKAREEVSGAPEEGEPEVEEKAEIEEEPERELPLTGKVIRALRKEAGLSQKGLGDELDVSPKTISSWETGKTSPDETNLANLRRFRDEMKDDLSPGYRIKAVRYGVGLSQKELAEKLDVSPTTVSKWETGGTTPGEEVLEKLSKIRNEKAGVDNAG